VADISGRGEKVGKVCERVNMVQILCTHECKWKKRYLLKLFLKWGEESIEKNGGGGKFKYNTFNNL
jgi:hypothetical protein